MTLCDLQTLCDLHKFSKIVIKFWIRAKRMDKSCKCPSDANDTEQKGKEVRYKISTLNVDSKLENLLFKSNWLHFQLRKLLLH